MPQAPCLSKSCTLRFRAGASSGLGHWGAAGPSRFSWPDSQTFSNYLLGTIAYFDSYVYDTALRAQRLTYSWDRQSEMDG